MSLNVTGVAKLYFTQESIDRNSYTLMSRIRSILEAGIMSNVVLRPCLKDESEFTGKMSDTWAQKYYSIRFISSTTSLETSLKSGRHKVIFSSRLRKASLFASS